MPFTRYACWDADRVHTVMSPDAENSDDAVFLAVHSDHDLIMLDPGARTSGQERWDARQRRPVPPREFLQDFLSPTRQQVHVAVLGETGSGKSHFIRWLALNIPARDDLYVLSIPKTGTNLRGVLERIIDVLPLEHSTAYREALNATGYVTASREQRRERLLSEIALAIGALQPTPGYQFSDVEVELIQGLPLLFHDPHIRKHMSRPGGIIEQLVDHISEAPREYTRREVRRAFQREDLPLTGLDTLRLSHEARAVHTLLLSYDELVPRAVDLINASLNTAIAGVLNFRGDKLLELLLDVRRYLRQVGKGLVLLIEDFARLQGVDSALLQALIETPGSGENALCELRWAMAVTRGYYEQLAETVKSRMDFLIDMDLPTRGDNAIVSQDNLAAFAARYLNAVRLDEVSLRRWYDSGPTQGHDAPVPNRCEACTYRDDCHQAFGAVQGVGLYPFNRNALANMAIRKDPDITERFNPRRLIKFVLAEVMDKHREDLTAGRFPSDRLLRYMGGSQLSAAIEDRLKRANPEDFPRQRATLELWGISGRPVGLPEGLYTAYGLPAPAIGDSAQLPEQPSHNHRPESSPPHVSVAERKDTTVQAIQRWAQGGVMPEQAATELRDYIYTALETYIDWDLAGLERTRFMQRAGTAATPFRARNIVFLRQQTQAAVSGVRLSIPLDPHNEDELRRTAIALEALRQYQRHRHWDFPHAFEGLVALSECLQYWSAALLDQFRCWADPAGNWDPVATAVELLAIGAALAGKLSASRLTVGDALNALFDTWPEHLPDQTKEWRDVYEAIRSHSQGLREIVRAWASGTKGGQVGAFLDPARVLPALRKVHRNWSMTAVPPENTDQLRSAYQTLARLQLRVRDKLPVAAQEEYQRRMAWLDTVRRYMDENTSRAQVVVAAQQLRDVITTGAIGVRASVRTAFDEALQAFSSVQLDAAIKAAQQLSGVTDPVSVLPDLTLDRSAAITASERFFTAADALIAEAESAISIKRSALDAQVGDGLLHDQEIVSTCLDELDRVLSVVGEGSC